MSNRFSYVTTKDITLNRTDCFCITHLCNSTYAFLLHRNDKVSRSSILYDFVFFDT